MNQLLEELNKLAEEIRINDPDRFAKKEEIIDIEELEETIEQREITETEWVELTPEEIGTKARNLFNNQVPMPVQKIPILSTVRKSITREVLEYEYHEYETGIFFKDKHTIPYQVAKYRQITDHYVTTEVTGWEDGPSIKIPETFFIQSLVGQMKPQQVKKIVDVKVIYKKPGKKK